MGKVQEYRQILRSIEDWDEYLLANSGLPGPRANIELAQAVAEEGDLNLFNRFLSIPLELAPTNSPQEFLVFCGVIGLGRLLSEGLVELLPKLRHYASDSRWRTREAVAMALQRLGHADMELLLSTMEKWKHGSLLEQRAVVVALCEPGLLREATYAGKVLHILDCVTEALSTLEDRKRPDFSVLRQALGYCWSVAVVALPSAGKPLMEKWLDSIDRDVRWIMRENLKKNRLIKMDPGWVGGKPCRKSQME